MLSPYPVPLISDAEEYRTRWCLLFVVETAETAKEQRAFRCFLFRLPSPTQAFCGERDAAHCKFLEKQ
jgi:hypothetical protein